MGAPRTTFRDPETGRWTRVCCECRQTKDLEVDFYKARREPAGSPRDWAYQCKICKVKQVRGLTKRQREDPKRAAEIRAQYAQLQREWRERNPERYRQARKRYFKNLHRDPARHARYLENRRIEYRLRLEQEGRSTMRVLSTATMGHEGMPELPAGPLADLLADLAKTRESVEQLAEEVGVSSRTFRRWREDEHPNVRFDVADAILIAIDRFWWEIWPEDEYPDLHARLAA